MTRIDSEGPTRLSISIPFRSTNAPQAHIVTYLCRHVSVEGVERIKQ